MPRRKPDKKTGCKLSAVAFSADPSQRSVPTTTGQAKPRRLHVRLLVKTESGLRQQNRRERRTPASHSSSRRTFTLLPLTRPVESLCSAWAAMRLSTAT